MIFLLLKTSSCFIPGDVILRHAAAEVHLVPGPPDGRGSKPADAGARHPLPLPEQPPVADSKGDPMFHSHVRQHVSRQALLHHDVSFRILHICHLMKAFT